MQADAGSQAGADEIFGAVLAQLPGALRHGGSGEGRRSSQHALSWVERRGGQRSVARRHLDTLKQSFNGV